jgi:hypothetical protein
MMGFVLDGPAASSPPWIPLAGYPMTAVISIPKVQLGTLRKRRMSGGVTV